MLKVLGVGLPRTGTATLAEALAILGFEASHDRDTSFPLWPVVPSDITAEAEVGFPVALYWPRLVEANPDCKVILTTRDIDTWWESIKWHINKIHASAALPHIHYSDLLHCLLFGSAYPHGYWYKWRFQEWNKSVLSYMDRNCHRLLVLDIVAGDKWDKVCPFLGVEEPDAEWPWLNKKVV